MTKKIKVKKIKKPNIKKEIKKDIVDIVGYVNNKEFINLLKSYLTIKDKSAWNRLGEIFLQISEKILNRPNFINYSDDWKDDMISDATFYMVKYIKSYDLKRDNPFAFFSQIAFNAFRQYINKANKQKKLLIPLDYIESFSNENDTSQIILNDQNDV